MTYGLDDSERLDSLIEQWLDDDLSPAEATELEAVLVESPAARTRFWEKASFDSLVHEAVALAGPEVRAVEPVQARSSHGAKRFAAVILAGVCLVAMGGGLGALVTKQALAGLGRSIAARFAVVEEGFESGPAPLAKYIPAEPGTWSGDSTAVVGAKRGVVPLAGARMLELAGPHSIDIDEPSEFASEIWQVIPMDVVRDGVAKAAQVAGITDGQMRIDLGASFNQREAAGLPPGAPRAAARAKVGGVGIFAFRGPISDVRALWNDRVGKALASSHTEQLLDENAALWQRVQVTLAVPPGTDFLLVHCYVRDSQRRPGAVFDGQFMDDIRISAFLEPTPGGGGL